ncbi:unnamed protein product [Pedinophyceae sp. YPF-701]|nr:unnamed protein product [Pedinophyceae sp. YPF-701]
MAFVYRTGRELGEPRTAGDAGPGSYDLVSPPVPARTSPAPFGSRRPKSSILLKTSLPGPGTYDSAEKIARANWKTDKRPTSGVASSAFRSETVRLVAHERNVDMPGPGTYKDGDGWIKKSHRYDPTVLGPEFQSSGRADVTGGQSSPRRVDFTKRAPVPSVPDRFRSYGYEEDEYGNLVAQIPEGLMTGTGVDRPGPTSYRPKVDVLKTKKTTDFGKARNDRSLFKPQTTPGPGAYDGAEPDPDVQAVVPAMRLKGWERHNASVEAIKGTHMFRSSIDRFHRSTTAAPPSTAYNPKLTDGYTSKRVAAFLTTGARPYQKDATKLRGGPTNMKNPGPGTYNYKSGMARDKRQAFTSTVPRFAPGRVTSPGPGTYENAETTSLAHKVQSKVGSIASDFCTKGQRFGSSHFLVQGASRSPGPGRYDLDIPILVQTYKTQTKPSSAFHSQVDRFKSDHEVLYIKDERSGLEVEYKKPTPHPATYSLPDQWTKVAKRNPVKGRPDDHFLCSSQRFPANELTAGQKISRVPGPGEYDPRSAVTRTMSPTGRGFGVGERLKTKDAPGPGPAAYNTRKRGSMITKSFNVTYD